MNGNLIKLRKLLREYPSTKDQERKRGKKRSKYLLFPFSSLDLLALFYIRRKQDGLCICYLCKTHIIQIYFIGVLYHAKLRSIIIMNIRCKVCCRDQAAADSGGYMDHTGVGDTVDRTAYVFFSDRIGECYRHGKRHTRNRETVALGPCSAHC